MKKKTSAKSKAPRMKNLPARIGTSKAAHVRGGGRPSNLTPGAASSDEIPSENVSLNYGKIKWTYTQQK